MTSLVPRSLAVEAVEVWVVALEESAEVVVVVAPSAQVDPLTPVYKMVPLTLVVVVVQEVITREEMVDLVLLLFATRTQELLQLVQG
jgi:hypothetical protein